MSEYCHHCGTTISEDIATLCPLCASKPDSLRREEIDEFAAKLKTMKKPTTTEEAATARIECDDLFCALKRIEELENDKKFLIETGEKLVRWVESPRHSEEEVRDHNGRLKDTKVWAAFYVAVRGIQRKDTAEAMKNTNDIVRQLLDLCERANTVMLGDTKHDGGEPEDNWIADYEAILDEAQCAAGIHLYSTNWKSGKAYDYCPFCGHEPNAGGMARELAAQDSDNSNDING